MDLHKIALIGTARQADISSAVQPQWGGELFASVQVDSPEDKILIAAAIETLGYRCGTIGAGEISLPKGSPIESQPIASAKLAGPIGQALASGDVELCLDFLHDLRQANMTLPAILLPLALDTKNDRLREGLETVIGERGRWLAEQNPAWGWVFTGHQSLSHEDLEALHYQWQRASFAERLRALQRVRRYDADLGREWATVDFGKNKAEHRSAIAECLEHGLSESDEPFLNELLNDRSVPVRQAAAKLLALLPQSALSIRMRQRAESVLMRDAQSPIDVLKLRVEAPEDLDKSWERDGIPRKVSGGRSPRAVWLESLFSLVPPNYLSQHLAAKPAEILHAMQNVDYDVAMIVGITNAALKYSETQPECTTWFRPLWDYWCERFLRAKKSTDLQREEELLRQLMARVPEIEAIIEPILEEQAAKGELTFVRMLVYLPRPWSSRFAEKFIATVAHVMRTRSQSQAYHWAVSLTGVARAIPLEKLEYCQQQLGPFLDPESASRNQHWIVVLVNFLETIRARKAFYAELANVNRKKTLQD